MATMIDSGRFQELLGDFRLQELFNELGWDNAGQAREQIEANGQPFQLTPIAQKRGVLVLLCSPDREGAIPTRPVQLKIEREARKVAHEHLLIFTDAERTTLTWLWVARAPGQPAVTRTHTWQRGTSGESLRQKLEAIVWSIEAEEAITLTDVVSGLKSAFDRDRVSKSFYAHFKKEHDSFSAFVEGLSDTTEKAWYASLMLNRLMFIYFIQRKGFLDDNSNYLTDKLRTIREQQGEGHFHSFYRVFLRRLFHEGLATPKDKRDADFDRMVGKVPYLNGGLFDLHELEEANPEIDIPDKAFERLFEFFDAWDWHLDDRPLASGNEINPDVLGYIFEKYINQKQMGAYYTKEDITEYIGKNTVLPHLLDQARKRCRVAFDGDESVWNLMREDPDRYLYPAMKTGVIDTNGDIVPETALPDFVQTGMHDPEARMFDNRYNLGEAEFHTAKGERGTLPTETWREYVERRRRCLDIRERLAAGEVISVDYLITLNLDIRQFMQDVIDNCNGPQPLRAIWQAIVGHVPERSSESFRHGISILDPTCGSGAFLFAALNILEPLYEACLDRMEAFVEDSRKLGRNPESDFVRVIEETARHPSRSYFVYKSIILNNLYGVDIMAEAVEICKLRLFLKLVSQVDSEHELEPLPDMDFNIRIGNTLVGFASEDQFDQSDNLASDQRRKSEIKARISDLADLFDRFREQQTVHGGQVTTDNKRKLRAKLSDLCLELDRYLARDFGVDPDSRKMFEAWKNSHQPFHWFAEFYGAMREGGFDVVIGNPPYVEIRDIREQYKPVGYRTNECGNLYAICSERALGICKNKKGMFGFIIPVASVCTDRYKSLKNEFLEAGKCFLSSYNDRPGKLFDGLEHIRLSIVLIQRGEKACHTTKYTKWNTNARSTLFSTLRYEENIPKFNWEGSIPKVFSPIEFSILNALNQSPTKIANLTRASGAHKVYFTRKLSGFVQILGFIPSITDQEGNCREPSELKELTFEDIETANFALALLNSNFFYWYLTLYSDVRNLNKREIEKFPIVLPAHEVRDKLIALTEKLMKDLSSSSEILTMRYKKHGILNIQCIYPKRSKDTIDQIDVVYGQAIGLTDEAIDFLINYDIKHRIGRTNDSQ